MSGATWFPGMGQKPFARHRLFCFPFAGGTPHAYRRLATMAPDWLDVVPVLLPGRDMRINDTPYAEIDAFLDGIVPQIVPHLSGSFGFLGYSMGARLSYMLARRLAAMGLSQPRYLCLCAHAWPYDGPPRSPLHTLPKAAFWDKIAEYGGTPAEIFEHPELMDLVEPMLRGDFAMAFEPLPRFAHPLDMPIIAIAGQIDPHAAPDQMRQWQVETEGPFDEYALAGGHFVIQSAPDIFANTVLSAIRKYIA
ncbi:surfactin synthase thioesterase subunit [Rubricella aquisinus]|uniref:Surfactin synthase thioesterase subunit n=1 Tax=Rubricella aquisinus TaxID=2028108 RepID=A0A840X0S2_9RHOB|nr:thioesterase [Rubricella aquisinus]MBB5516324.1 surfactin synthase thioesterase subunit [Rubricella aquisinus]